MFVLQNIDAVLTSSYLASKRMLGLQSIQSRGLYIFIVLTLLIVFIIRLSSMIHLSFMMFLAPLLLLSFCIGISACQTWLMKYASIPPLVVAEPIVMRLMNDYTCYVCKHH